MQVPDRPQHDVLGAAPVSCVADERDPEPAGDEGEQGGLIRGFLHDAWVGKAAPGASLHETVVVSRTLAPREPHEVGIGQVAQTESLQSRQGMPPGYAEDELVRSHQYLIQFRVALRHVEDEARIQPAGANGLDLFQREQRTELQLGVWMPLAESPEGVWNDTVPRRALGEAHPQR